MHTVDLQDQQHTATDGIHITIYSEDDFFRAKGKMKGLSGSWWINCDGETYRGVR